MKVLTVACAVLLLATVANGQMTKVLLTDYPNAKCLDGTSSGYYIERSSTGSPNWVVFLEGGGACETISGCIARSKTQLGSSKNWAATVTDNSNLLSTNCTFNTGFCDFNHVYVPYCSGDVYTGQETAPGIANLQFSGHLTIEAIIDDLTSSYGMAAEDGAKLLLSGSSAGGIGTFVNADFVASKLPGMDVKANPQGGFFFPNVTAFPYWLDNEFVYPENNTEIAIFDAYLNPACVKEHGEIALCNDLFFLYQYITTPVFVAENQFDANQLFAQLHVPEKDTPTVQKYIGYFGDKMRTALSQVTAPNGLWAPSCVCHTGNLNMKSTVTVDDYTMASGLLDWYFKGESVNVVESCPTSQPCNTACDCS